MADREKKAKEIPFTGKWVSDVDPVVVGENFTTLKNMRYTEAGIRGVAGMSKINTTALSPVLTRSAYHFRKATPSENHLLLQLYASGTGKVYSLESTVPGTSNTLTLLADESTGASRGYFSPAPGGSVIFCNSVQTLIWGGNEQRIGAFIEYDPGGAFWYDHTEKLRDNLPATYASTVGAGGGLDAYTALLLHLDNNLTDSSPTTPHTVKNYAKNLLANGSFETAGAGGGDVFGSWVETAGDGAIADEVTEVYSQAHAAKLTAGATANTKLDQNPTVIAETDYRLVFWTRGDGTHEGRYGIYDVTNAADIVAVTATGVTAEDYTEVVVDFTTPAGCTEIRIDLWCPSTNTGIAYFDWVHVFPTSGMVTFSSSEKQFGTHSASFDGSDSSLAIIDNADFDFSTNPFTIDLWAKFNALADKATLFCQYTDANNWVHFYIDTDGSAKLDICVAGATTTLVESLPVIVVDTWYHIEIDRSTTAYTIFIDGVQRGSATSAVIPANYTGPIYLGAFYDGTTFGDFLDGYLDEYRVSNTQRHTVDFERPITAYITVSSGNFYVGATRPLDGVKFYVKTANTAAGTMTAYYWNGSDWAACSGVVDGTTGLTVTGTLSFTSTVGSAKPSYMNGLFLYWYKVSISATASTQLYYVTLSSPMQTVTDIWDGIERTVAAMWTYFSSAYSDATYNVLTNEYDSSDDNTYVDLSSMSNDSNVVYVGFTERITGIHLFIPNAEGNTAESVYLSVSYWNGASWTEVTGLVDGTKTGLMTLNTSGMISWTAPDESLEFTKMLNNDVPLYYYKIGLQGSATLTGGPLVFYVTGIPAQASIKTYRFPLYAMDRVFLCNETCGYPNKVRYSAANSDCVFNGDDSDELYIGDENPLTGALWLYSQFGSNLYNIEAFTKASETWVLAGNTPEEWRLYRVSANIGCPSPMTMCVMNAPYELYQQSNRTISIWQGSNGIYIFDGKGFTPIHGDIEDWFDARNSYAINRSVIEDFCGFYDDAKLEYHWLFASGTSTTLNKEFVYDLRRRKWFEIDRGTGNYLQLGCSVQDTHGNTYCYGFGSDGFIYRLENGTTFNSTGIAHSVVFGDIAVAGSTWIITKVRNVKLHAVSKTITANDITLQHWADGSATPTSFTMDAKRTGYRITASKKSENITDAVFHRFGLSITTTDEPVGFEPIIFAIMHEVVREDTR